MKILITYWLLVKKNTCFSIKLFKNPFSMALKIYETQTWMTSLFCFQNPFFNFRYFSVDDMSQLGDLNFLSNNNSYYIWKPHKKKRINQTSNQLSYYQTYKSYAQEQVQCFSSTENIAISMWNFDTWKSTSWHIKIWYQ